MQVYTNLLFHRNFLLIFILFYKVLKLHKQDNSADVEQLMKQLIETRKSLEEYKQKFLKKEAEAERYKQQLLLIAQSKNIC